MRFFAGLLFLFLFAGQASAWDGSAAALSWQGFSLPEGTSAASSFDRQIPAPRGPGLPGSKGLPAQGAPGKSASAPAENGGPAARPFLLGVTLVPPAGAYFYGPEAKDGLPTTLSITCAPVTPFAPRPEPSSAAYAELMQTSGKPLPALLPAAVRKKDTSLPSVPGAGNADTLVYPGPVTFWAEVPALLPFYSSVAVTVRVSGLFCSETSCAPFDLTRELVIERKDVEGFAAAASQPWWGEWRSGVVVQLSVPAADETAGTAPAVSSSSAQPVPAALPRIRTEAEKALERQTEFFATLSPQPSDTEIEVQALGEALFLGVLAGVLLNLMPCVLPVISLKFSALMAVTAMTDKREQARAFRRHCLIFAGGVLTWFLILALLLGSAGWVWGELFQSPPVIVCLGLVMFLLGLSLFGVFSLPLVDLKVTSESHPHWQAFASGLLATLLATPCSGPLLGGVLGWALRQPFHVLTLTVVSVGIGMALPYWVLAFRPGLLHLVPRPGTWTVRLEQLLGFFLMGSVLYLTTLLPSPWIPPFLFNLLAVAFAAWLWGQIGHLGASRLRRGISRCVAVLAVVLACWWGSSSIKPDFTWEEFDPNSFMEILGTEPLMLEFTADWCPSCKALEHTTLNKKRMAALREQYKMRTIKVDLTRNAEAGKALLKALDSGSIPVIALFPKGDKAKRPVVLRDLVTPSQLKEALESTF